MTDRDAATVAKALSHPERIAILRDLRDHEAPVSATDFSRRVRGEASLRSEIGYHFSALRKLELITATSRRPVRGSSETFYRIGGPRGELALMILAAIDVAESD
jgi:DNA-binding transcriptional ArsR family regulator